MTEVFGNLLENFNYFSVNLTSYSIWIGGGICLFRLSTIRRKLSTFLEFFQSLEFFCLCFDCCIYFCDGGCWLGALLALIWHCSDVLNRVTWTLAPPPSKTTLFCQGYPQLSRDGLSRAGAIILPVLLDHQAPQNNWVFPADFWGEGG